MYIINSKQTNEIIAYGENLTYLENGYPFLADKKTAYCSNFVNVFEVSEIPSRVEPYKYCYIEADGFYPNPDYKEPNPYGIPDETYETIIDDYTTQLIEEGVIG